MTCTDLSNVASELALDLLGGKERAAALEHLEQCSSCRQEVALLASTAEEILTVAPDVEPSARFEEGVLERIERLARPGTLVPAAPSRRRRPRQAVRGLLALAAAVAVVTAAAVLPTSRPAEREVAVRGADMLTGTGQAVGDVHLEAEPAAVRLTIPDWVGLVRSYGANVDAPYWLAVETADGSRDLHRLPPADEHPWTVNIGGDPDAVTTVSVVDNRGNVWCTARFA